MVQRITRITTCDHCAHDQEPERDAVRSIKITIDRMAPHRVDLCDIHAALWDKLKIIATTRGTRS